MRPDRYKYFRVEAREILDQLGQATLDLEKDVPGPDAVSRLLRLTHTLKGAARVVKEIGIADCAHAFEDALTLIRDVVRPVARDEVDRMLLLIDEMNGQVARLTPPPADAETVRADQPDQSRPVFSPGMEDLDVLLGGVFEARVGLGALRGRLADLDRGRHVATLMADQLNRPRSDARDGGSILNRGTRQLAQDVLEMLRRLDREWTLNIDHLDRELSAGPRCRRAAAPCAGPRPLHVPRTRGARCRRRTSGNAWFSKRTAAMCGSTGRCSA